MALTPAQQAAYLKANPKTVAPTVKPVIPDVKDKFVTPETYRKAVDASIFTDKQIADATAKGINPATGTSIAAGPAPKQAAAGQWVSRGGREIWVVGAPPQLTAPKPATPETPNKSTSTTVNGVATTSLFQDLKAGKITNEQYQAKIKENMALDTTKQNIEFGVDAQGVAMGDTSSSPLVAKSAASAAKYKTEAEKTSGPMPQPSKPGENETTEDALRRQANDANNLSEWYKKVAKASQDDVGVSTAMSADLKGETEKMRASVDAMVANLNAGGREAYANVITESLADIIKSGGGGLNADTLAQITQMANDSTDPAELKAKVSALIKNTPSSSMLEAGITKDDTGFTTKEGLKFSINGLGTPDISLDGSPIAATGGDLAAMELAVGVKQSNIGLEQELALLKDYATSVARQTVTAKAEIAALQTDSLGRVNESQKAALDELYYSERKLSLEKDKSLRNLTQEDAKMEGYMKGQLEAWGANESTAGLAVMGALKVKFLTAYADTEAAYDTELAHVSDLEVQARMAYTNRVVEISNQALIATQKVNDTLFDAIDKVETGTSTAYQNRDLKTMDAYRKYFGDLRDMNAAEAKAKADAAKDTRDFNFDLMKEYADQSGYQYEISPDGSSIAPMRDAKGNKILTLAGGKLKGSGGGGGPGSKAGAIKPADQKWIDEMLAMGYSNEQLQQKFEGRDQLNALTGYQRAIWEDYARGAAKTPTNVTAYNKNLPAPSPANIATAMLGGQTSSYAPPPRPFLSSDPTPKAPANAQEALNAAAQATQEAVAAGKTSVADISAYLVSKGIFITDDIQTGITNAATE